MTSAGSVKRNTAIKIIFEENLRLSGQRKTREIKARKICIKISFTTFILENTKYIFADLGNLCLALRYLHAPYFESKTTTKQ